MASDPSSATDFYSTLQGAVAARLVRERIAEIWPDLSRQLVLGVGFPSPYLRLWREEAAGCIAVIPAQLEAVRWPAQASLTCAAEEDSLPFADLCFDRVLLIHGLEVADNARRLLREVWRVLRDDGRLLVVAPNRRGWWAHVDSTPFGQGQPYSPGQIDRLLAASLFRVERRERALYLPPSPWRVVLRSARLWEEAGQLIAPRFAGVCLTEASKDVFAALPVAARPGFVARRRVVPMQAG